MAERPASGADGTRAYLSGLVTASKTPGMQYVVVDATRVVFEYYGGWADVRRRAPMEADVSLMAYSMSKTITAVAVLQLVEARKVGLDEPLTRFVGDSPYGPRVTVRQLIAHTSGTPNPIPLRWVHAAAQHGDFDEGAALAAVMRDHANLAFEPGTKYAYSNIGYWLGRIVERASGEPFQAYVRAHILQPLGIPPWELGYVVMDPTRHATGYLEKYSLMNLAKGFLIDRALIGDYAGRWLEIRSHYLNGPAFGGLVGTARAFGALVQDQLRPHSALVNDATRRLLYTRQQTTDGTPVAMTLGWHMGDMNGTPYFYKEGGGGGFHCMMRVYPTSGRAAVLMTNATGFDVQATMDAVDPRLLQVAMQVQ